MATVTITKRGRSVSVTDVSVAAEMPTRILTATTGSTTVVRRVTLAAADGPRPTVTTAQLQTALDAERDSIADEAAWRAKLAAAAASLT